jgi:transposase-like protein
MHRTQQPLPVWFWAAYLVTTQTPGMSALQFQRQLGIKRYETAFLLLHKLRAAMVRPGRDRIGAKWPVEVDETFIGGTTKGEGCGRHHKTLVVGMVEVLPRKKALGPDPNLPSGQRPQHQGGHGRSFIAGRLRLQVIQNRKQETLESMVLANVQEKAEVRTDGWTGYDNLCKLGYNHIAVSVQGDQVKTDQHLPMIHIVFGNLDAWLLGTHHGVSPVHLQGYLNEFVFRFNRRFWPMVGFDSVLLIAGQVKSPTCRDFYESAQEKSNPAEPDEPVLIG